jgi:hypothetical protein
MIFVAAAEDFPPLFVREKVDGLKVVNDVVMESPLTAATGRFVPYHGFRVLTLEDDSTRTACEDCPFIADPELPQTPFGQTRAHRRAKHGVNIGGRPSRAGNPRASAEEAEQAGLVPHTVTLPAHAAAMTLHEAFELYEEIDTWAVVLANQQEKITELVQERDEAVRARRVADRELTALKKKMAKAMGLTIVTTGDE